YYFAHSATSSTSDYLRIYVEDEDAGSTRTLVFQVRGSARDVDAAWTSASVGLTRWAGRHVRILVVAQDGASGNLLEAGIDDVPILVNMSVWRSLPALQTFVYRSAHADVMRRRREWFERFATPYMALWWVRAGHRPSLAEARDRLERLARLGPTPDAFTFRDAYQPPSTNPGRLELDAAFC